MILTNQQSAFVAMWTFKNIIKGWITNYKLQLEEYKSNSFVIVYYSDILVHLLNSPDRTLLFDIRKIDSKIKTFQIKNVWIASFQLQYIYTHL